jgi:TolB-like protein
VSNGEIPSPAPLGESRPNNLLDSWKEIATYLGRDVRTVQRWEKKEGLPMHRQIHEKLGTVFAYKSEIDAWWRERSANLAPKAEDKNPTQGPHIVSWPTYTAKKAGEEIVSATPSARIRPLRVRVRETAAVLVALLLLGMYVAWRSGFLWVQPTPAKIRIAVLPFKNLSGDPEQEYFSDGMTEEMITELGRMQPDRLGVIARTSAMLYKNTQKDLGQICRELGVQYALEGSVFLAGERTRITAQLIQCSDQTHVWADSSERELANIVSLQSEVAASVARKVRVALNTNEQFQIREAHPLNPEAYEAYLKGIYFWGKLSPDSTQTPIKYLEASIQKDPGYAPAYARLATCYLQPELVRGVSPYEAQARAKAAATEAAAIDYDSAEAHLSLATVADNDWDWPLAEREFRHAIKLDPNLTLAHIGYGYLLAVLRKPEESLNELTIAQSLDPVSQATGLVAVAGLYYSRRYDQSIALAQQWLELYPDAPRFHHLLAEGYAQKGLESMAVKEYLRAAELTDSNGATLTALQSASRESGLKGLWQQRLAYDKESTSQTPRTYDLAFDYAALGDRGRALVWLERAYDEHQWRLMLIGVDPTFDVLRADPHFQDLLRRMRLPN